MTDANREHLVFISDNMKSAVVGFDTLTVRIA
jgi:hypothetical protein